MIVGVVGGATTAWLPEDPPPPQLLKIVLKPKITLAEKRTYTPTFFDLLSETAGRDFPSIFKSACRKRLQAAIGPNLAQ
jgi:hypothetical protein